MAAFEKEGMAVRIRRTWVLVATAVITVLGPFAMLRAIGPRGGHEHPAFLLLPVLYLLAIFGGAYAWRRWRREPRGAFRADAEGLWVDGVCVAKRSQLRRADIVRTDEGLVVRLRWRGRINRGLDVAVESEEEGHAVLAGLRLDVGSSVADFRMTAGTARRRMAETGALSTAYAAALTAAIVWLYGDGLRGVHDFRAFAARLGVFVALYIAASLVMSLASSRIARHTKLRVSVGADGVRIRSKVKTTFHPFSSIAGVSTDGHHLTLRLADGTSVTVHDPHGGKLGKLIERGEDAHQLAARIEMQLASFRAEPAPDASAVARNGRSAAEWIKGASALRESAATFRTNVIPTEQLWRIVEDATATASARAGAALALRHDLDDGARVRLRVAADACAAPNLRIALETVAALDDEAALREAFEPLVDQEDGRTMPMRTMSK